MAGAYSHLQFVQFPQMDAHSLDGFGRRLLAQFEARKKLLGKTKLPRRARALARAVDALGAALALQQSRAEGNAAAAKLDATVDATWAALVAWLEGFARLAWTDAGKAAKAILEAVFEDRLKFTQLEYVPQWSAANARIAKLFAHPKGGGESHAEAIRMLGGELFLDEIREKHHAFGDALGISQATEAPEEVAVREPFDAVIKAAKEYVGAAMNLDDEDVADSEAVKEFLLHVMDEFSEKSRARRSARKSEDGPEKDGEEKKDEKKDGGEKK